MLSMSCVYENKSVVKILPEENAVVLENNRKINYNALVLATGIREDASQIEGLKEALNNVEAPVYTPNL